MGVGWFLRTAAVVLGAVVLGFGLYLGVTTAVEVHVDEQVLATRTGAQDVQGLLTRLEVRLDDADQVQPGLDTELVDGLVVEVRRAVTATVLLDDRAGLLGLDAERFEVTAVLDTFGDLLAASDAAGARELPARFEPELTTTLEYGGILTVEIAVPVTILADGQERTLETFAPDVRGALLAAGIEVDDDDRIEPRLRTPLGATGVITVARVERVVDLIDVPLAHAVIERQTDDLFRGERQIATTGRDGLRRDAYAVVLVDGVEASRALVDEQVLEGIVDEVVLIGTREPPPPPPSTPPSTRSGGAAASDGARVVYLTFDDGPHPTYTPQLLDLLAARGARASFFVLGSEVVQHPGLAARIVREGHAIGNHTWSHPDLTQVPAERLRREILETQAAVATTTGRTPACFRPPFGARDGSVNSEVAELGLRMVLWDIDPLDWQRPGTTAIVDHILEQVRPGSVVLLHDGRRDREQTVAATDRLLTALTEQGYEVRALPGC